MSPFQAGALHPLRRAWLGAAEEVERRTDAHEHRRLEPFAHSTHPELLAGGAQADPDNLGAALVDVARDRLLLRCAQNAERRRARSTDLQPRVRLCEDATQPILGLRSSAEEVMPQRAGGSTADLGHEVAPGDASCLPAAGSSRRPGDGCPIGEREIGGTERFHQLRRPLRGLDHMDIDKANVRASALSCPLLDGRSSLRERRHGDGYSKNWNGFHPRSASS